MYDEPTHGYQIIADIHTSFGILLSPGTIYPLLDELTEENLLKVNKIKRKKIYSLSPEGRKRALKTIDLYDRNLERIIRLLKTKLGEGERRRAEPIEDGRVVKKIREREREPMVLVVDDEDDIRELVERYLSEEGYEVLTAKNAGEAIIYAEQEQPDLILMDVVMPGRSGFDACRDLKLKPDTSHIPVILISVLTRSTDREMAFEAKADSFIPKPFTKEQILEEINEVMSG
ncbi:MAG: response regulator [Candidatus Bathyarchaeia archaeon]